MSTLMMALIEKFSGNMFKIRSQETIAAFDDGPKRRSRWSECKAGCGGCGSLSQMTLDQGDLVLDPHRRVQTKTTLMLPAISSQIDLLMMLMSWPTTAIVCHQFANRFSSLFSWHSLGLLQPCLTRLPRRESDGVFLMTIRFFVASGIAA